MRQTSENSRTRQGRRIPSTQLTNHACQRLSSRGIPLEAVEVVLEYGRVVHARGAQICVIGRKEVEEFGMSGINLSRYEGIHVLCSRQGSVLTAYRNRDSLNLKPSRPRPARKRYGW